MKKLYTGKKLFTASDKLGVIEDFALLEEDGKVAFVGKAKDYTGSYDERTDLGDAFVMPGIIDCHVHLICNISPEEKEMFPVRQVPHLVCKGVGNAYELLSAGVMACRDLGAVNGYVLGIRDVVNEGRIPGPEIIACGNAISVTGGHGWDIGYEADGVDGIRQCVRQVVRDGANVVKLMVSGGVNSPGPEQGPCELTEEEIKVGIETAHAWGRKVCAHAHGNTAIRLCVRHGIDSIEHGVFMTEDIMDEMVEKGIYLVPTLCAPYHAVQEGIKLEPNNPDHRKSQEVLQRHRDMLKRCSEKGVKIAFGTDAGSFCNPYSGIRDELRLMKVAGMREEAVLKAATIDGAELAGVSDHLGSLEVGKEASFLVFRTDLLEHMENATDECLVYQRGKRIV